MNWLIVDMVNESRLKNDQFLIEILRKAKIRKKPKNSFQNFKFSTFSKISKIFIPNQVPRFDFIVEFYFDPVDKIQHNRLKKFLHKLLGGWKNNYSNTHMLFDFVMSKWVDTNEISKRKRGVFFDRNFWRECAANLLANSKR